VVNPAFIAAMVKSKRIEWESIAMPPEFIADPHYQMMIIIYIN